MFTAAVDQAVVEIRFDGPTGGGSSRHRVTNDWPYYTAVHVDGHGATHLLVYGLVLPTLGPPVITLRRMFRPADTTPPVSHASGLWTWSASGRSLSLTINTDTLRFGSARPLRRLSVRQPRRAQDIYHAHRTI